MKEKFNIHKVLFKNLLKSNTVKLGMEINYEDFFKRMNEFNEYAQLEGKV